MRVCVCACACAHVCLCICHISKNHYKMTTIPFIG